MELSLLITASSNEEYEAKLAQFLNQLRTAIALPAFKEKNSKSEFPNIQVVIEAKRLKDIDWDTLLRTIKDAEHAIPGVGVIKIKNNDHNISGLVLRGTAENRKFFIISKIFLRSLAIPDCSEYLRRCITQNEKPSQFGIFNFKSMRISPEYEHMITIQKGMKPGKFTLPAHLHSKYMSDMRFSENNEEIIINVVFSDDFSDQLRSYRKFLKFCDVGPIIGTPNRSPLTQISFDYKPGSVSRGIFGFSCRKEFFPKNEKHNENALSMTSP